MTIYLVRSTFDTAKEEVLNRMIFSGYVNSADGTDGADKDSVDSASSVDQISKLCIWCKRNIQIVPIN